MRIKEIEIEGYKSIRKLGLPMRPINILIGANGSGKSNYIDFFRLVTEILNGRLQSFILKNGGADSHLHYGSKTTNTLVGALEFSSEDGVIYGYDFTLDVNHANDSFFIIFEHTTGFTPDGCGSLTVHGGKSVDGEIQKIESSLSDNTMHNSGSTVIHCLREMTLYHFHDTSATAPVKKTGAINDNMKLRKDASNLAAFLYALKHSAPNNYNDIRDAVRLVAPFFDDFILRPVVENTDTIRLEWRERNSDFPFMASHLSDGTLRFICLATALQQPNPPAVMLFDEPELGLHPYALEVLAALMRKASLETQLIVSTQSAPFIDLFEPEDIIVAERHDGETTLKRLAQPELTEWLNDYTISELWNKNILGGRPG